MSGALSCLPPLLPRVTYRALTLALIYKYMATVVHYLLLCFRFFTRKSQLISHGIYIWQPSAQAEVVTGGQMW